MSILNTRTNKMYTVVELDVGFSLNDISGGRKT